MVSKKTLSYAFDVSKRSFIDFSQIHMNMNILNEHSSVWNLQKYFSMVLSLCSLFSFCVSVSRQRIVLIVEKNDYELLVQVPIH